MVYTGGKGKIAEHGGANPQDRNVPLVVAGNPIGHHDANTRQVETEEDRRALTPLFWTHVNPYGTFSLQR